MENVCEKTDEARTYFVYGSGLMPVPYWRLNEVPRLRAEFHADEVSRAMVAARARFLA